MTTTFDPPSHAGAPGGPTPAQPPALMDALLRHLPDLVFDVAGGAVRWVSPNVTEILGRDPASIIGRPVDDLIHPDDRAGLTMEELAPESDRTAIRRRVLRADGRTCWFEVRVQVYAGPDGESRRAIVARLVDDHTAEARELDTLRGTLESLPFPVLVVNRARRVTAMNAAWRRQERQSSPPSDGRPLRDVFRECMEPPHVEMVARAVDDAFEGREPGPVVVRCDHDDGPQWWQISACFAQRGGFVTVTFEDVSPLVRATEEQQAQRDTLREAMEIAHAATWRADMATRSLTWSPGASEVLHAEVADDVATMETLLHPDDAERVLQAVRGDTGEHGPISLRFRLKSGDGWRWVENRVVREVDGHGVLTGYHGIIQDVQEQVDREAALRESDERQRAALRLARASLWRWDRRTRLTWNSPALYDMLGFAEEDRSPSNLHRHPDDQAAARAAIDEAIRQRQPYEVRYRVAHADGRWIWVEERGDPAFDAAGELTGYDGTTQDVDEQVRREEALHERDARLREAFRIARATAWAWDRRTREVTLSPDLFELLGIGALPKRFEDRMAQMHPDDREPYRQATEDSIRRREPFRVRYRLPRPDGGWLWIEERGNPVFDEAGELTGYRGTAQDVDDQVRREEALRESDERQRAALGVARATIWEWDYQTKQIWRSPDLYVAMGYAEAEIPALFDDRVALRHPDDTEHTRREAEAAMRARRPFVVRFRIAIPGGGWNWVEQRGEPRYDGHGEYLGFRGTTQDIDELVRREEALRESDDRQREALHIARAAMWEWDARTGVLTRSPEFAEMLGFEVLSDEEADRLTLRHPDDAATSQRAIELAIQARLSYSVRYRVRTASGAWKWLEQRGTPRYDADGRYTGYRGTVQDIDEQVAREEALRESDRLQREALEIARASRWRWDPAAGTVEESPDLFSRLGYDAPPSTYEEHLALRHPDDRERCRAESRAAIEARQPYSIRYRLARKDGDYVWIESRGVPEFDAAGNFVCYRGTAQDIDEQVRREEALRESDDRQREALKIARASTWILDLATERVTQSPDLYHAFGYETVPVTREELREMTHPADRPVEQSAIAAIRARRPYTVRYRMARTDGSWAWVEARGVPVFDDGGRLIAYRGTRQDIDEQVRREEALRESDDRQREALRVARASVWTWDRRTHEIWQSSDLYDALGHQTMPQTFEERVAQRHPDDRKTSVEASEDAIRRRVPYTVRYRFARPDGGWAWIEERGEPVFDAAGELTGYRGTRQDVDEQVRREEALRESAERQRQALRIARASVWTWNPATREEDLSPDLYLHLGYDSLPGPDERPLLRHPDHRERSLQEAFAAMRARQPYSTRYLVKRADGTWAWVESRGEPQFAPDGTYVGYRGTVQEVDEQVRREEALRESDDRQRAALRVARASVWVWDRATRALTQSDDLYQLLGYERAPSNFDDRIALRHPEDGPASRETAEGAIRRREPYLMRYRLKRPGGGWVWIEERGTPIFDARGELTGYRGTSQDVDEQVRREEALRESDDRQREALRIARASTWTWDRRTRVLHQTNDLYRALGYDREFEDWPSRLEIRHPDDREPSRLHSEQAIRRRVPYVMRYRLARADGGGWVWIEERGTPVLDASGTLTGYRGTTQDVDEQVRREEDLHEALKMARAGFWYRGKADSAPWWSPEIYDLVGLDRSIVPTDGTWVRHPDDAARVTAVTRQAMRERVPYTVRYRALHHGTGEWVWVEVAGSPVHAADGAVVGYRGVIRDISEDVERTSDLRRSQALLDEAQRLTLVGSWAADLDTGVEQWSEGLYRLLGYHHGEVTPSREAILARIHPEDRAAVAERSARVRDGQQRVGGAFRIVLPDGSVRHVMGSAEYRSGGEGGRPELLGVLQDITEQVAAEARLRQSEERLQAVVDSVGDGITLLSRDGKGDWANDAFFRMVGYTREELESVGPSILFDRATIRDVVRWMRAPADAVGSVLPRTYPMRLHRKDGSVLTAEATPSILRDGEQVVGLLSVIRDTTERDRLLAQVRSANVEIEQILQTAPLPIIVIQQDGTIHLANRRTVDTFGWTPEELLGQDVSVLAGGLDPASHREYIQQYDAAGHGRTAHTEMIGRTIEVVARRRDGSEFPAEVSVTEMVGPDGERRFLGMISDLTERKRAEEELTRMQKAEALGTLVAGVAHDFNNLLTAMVGGIAMAKSQPGQERWLDLAGEAADRATRLVQQLLQFSRRSRPEQQEIDPASLVERTTALVRETFDRRIAVSLDLPTVWGVIAGDEGQLQQVVMNLLVNARDAVLERAEQERDGYQPAIHVAVNEDRLHGRPAVRIDVRDNGPGMSAAVRARAFDPFFTTKPVGQGTGLGLATAGGIIERHEGEVAIDSAVGAGTTVSVWLPLVTSGRPGAPAGPTASRGPVPAATRTIMVVDDEDMVRSITTGYLEAAGYRVVQVGGGQAAIDALGGGARVDIVLTDINMPSPNGWELLAHITAQPGMPPVVVASGYADAETARARGAAGFLHKPFSQADLTRTIEEILRRE